MSNLKHGMRHTRQYNTWSHILSRCNRKKAANWKHYGGRGISVCDKWLTFEGFWEDMGSTYSETSTLDRIDNNGDYCKENCRWTSQLEQVRNRTTTIWVNYKGEEHVLSKLCSDMEMNYHLVYQRLFKYDWPVEKALTTESRIKKIKKLKPQL